VDADTLVTDAETGKSTWAPYASTGAPQLVVDNSQQISGQTFGTLSCHVDFGANSPASDPDTDLRTGNVGDMSSSDGCSIGGRDPAGSGWLVAAIIALATRRRRFG